MGVSGPIRPRLSMHVGLNKVGSTFLQSLLISNRAVLEAQGIHYPGGSLRGGNAGGLVDALRSGRVSHVQEFLAVALQSAERRGLKRTLLSSEGLYHDLVRRDRRELFEIAARNLGLSSVDVLVIFRHPVEHSISAYAHRSGRHALRTFPEWIVEDYEFPCELERFLSEMECSEIVNWTVAPYVRGGLDLVVARWLGSVSLSEAAPRQVNVSPTLVEAEFLNDLRHRWPAGAIAVRRRLKRVHAADKAPDQALRRHYEGVAARALEALNPELQRLSDIVGQDLTVQVEDSPECLVDSEPHLALSRAQLDAIVDGCRAEASRSGWERVVRASMRWLGRVARKARGNGLRW